MSDPILQLPNPVISTGANVEAVLADADAARSDFFNQANAFFTEQGHGAEPAESAPVALAKPAAQPVKSQAPAAAPVAAPAKPVSGKVPAAPVAPAAPAPAPTTPAVPAPVSDDADLPREFRPGSVRAEQWNKMHATRDALRVERDQLKAKYEEAAQKLSTAVPSEELTKQLQALKAERDTYLEKLEAVAFERSPRFEAAFKPRVDAAVSLAKASVGPEHATKVEQLLALPDSEFRNVQLNTLAEGLSPLALGKLANAIAEVDKVNNERASVAAKGSEIWRQWQQEAQASQTQQQQLSSQEAQQVFASEFEGWKDFEMFKEKPGDAAHNQAVQQRLATAKSIFSGGLDLSELSRASFWAALGPDLVGALTAERSEKAALQAELAALRNAGPGNAGDGSSGAPSGDEVDSTLGYGGGIAALVQREGLLR